MKKYVGVIILLTIAGLGFRLFLALHLPNDEPDDGRLYARIAVNVLEHRSYSIETEEPYSPTLIRVPGYPLFLAGVYAVFGRDNNRAVRVVQAVLDTITCWLVALLALAWSPGRAGILACRSSGGPLQTSPPHSESMQSGIAVPPHKRLRLFTIALGMAVCCPFPAIYTTTILTETCTTLLATMCALSASLAMNTECRRKSAGWWLLAGFSGGLATMFRPDSGLFVAAVGCTLALVCLYRAIFRRRSFSDHLADVCGDQPRQILARTFLFGAMLTIGFSVALGPWTIRNARVLRLFQPIAPAQANMPGEFVPRGYIQWLKTWVDDVKYTETIEWSLDEQPIHVEQMPDYAFDSPEERDRVAELLQRYNNPPSTPPQSTTPETKAPSPTPGAQNQAASAEPTAPDQEPAEDAEEPEEDDTPDATEATKSSVEMTPEVDAGFGEIARERIAHHPLRYYLIVPLKRACSLWFDTHSQYYPFQGELLPLASLDHDIHQQYWLPFFSFLTLLYTGLGVAGAWVMWRDKQTRRWLLLLGFLILPRFAFLTTMENPEPRYVVEFFAFVIAAGSLAMLAGVDRLLRRLKVSRERVQALP